MTVVVPLIIGQVRSPSNFIYSFFVCESNCEFSCNVRTTEAKDSQRKRQLKENIRPWNTRFHQSQYTHIFISLFNINLLCRELYIGMPAQNLDCFNLLSLLCNYIARLKILSKSFPYSPSDKVSALMTIVGEKASGWLASSQLSSIAVIILVIM